MGLVTSKDEAGRVVLAGVPKDILDYKGRDLRDTMDACLEKYMWTFTIGGLFIAFPICVKYKTQNPLIAAAVISPLLDMAYGTNMCSAEKDAFVAHYKKLQQHYADQVEKARQMGALPEDDDDGKR